MSDNEKLKAKNKLNSELNRIGKKNVLKNMEKAGWNQGTVKTAFVRGEISKFLARNLEAVTCIDMKFWMFPLDYKTNGERL